MTSTILVVGDTPANRQALRGTLKDAGCQVSVATRGTLALDNQSDAARRTALCQRWLA